MVTQRAYGLPVTFNRSQYRLDRDVPTRGIVAYPEHRPSQMNA